MGGSGVDFDEKRHKPKRWGVPIRFKETCYNLAQSCNPDLNRNNDMSPFKVVSIGDFVCDFFIQLDLPIQPHEVKFAKWSKVEPGGASNFAIVAQRLGVNCIPVGIVGSDMYGDLILDVLREEKIDVSFTQQLPNAQTQVVLSLADSNQKGHAFVAVNLASATYYSLDEAVKKAIGRADAIYIQGYSMREEAIVSAIEYAYSTGNKNNIPIYMDIGPLGNTLRPERRRLVLSQTDIFLMTEEELLAFTGQRDFTKACDDLLRASRVRMLVVKLGDRGCRIVTRDGTLEFPAYPVEARDQIGCGDSFNAAFIFAQLSGLPIEKCAMFANAVGAAKARKVGPGRNMPRPPEIASVISQFNVPVVFDLVKGLQPNQ